MTNHWADMANASLVLVMGANPVENHPASLAHINKARERQKDWGNTGATMIVVDPRRTRTALQADKYVRIRPGTDIAFVNSMLNHIIASMDGDITNAVCTAGVKTKFFEYLEQTANGAFYTDGDATHASTKSVPVPDQSQYTDARFILKTAGDDYDRETIVASTGDPAVGGEDANTIISNFPKKAATVDADPNTVYNRLKAHVAPYDQDTIAGVCGCTAAEIREVADEIIKNSRCSSVAPAVGNQDPKVEGYRVTTHLYAMGLTQHTCGAQNVKMFAVLQTLMGNMGRCGGGINALRGIHNVQGSTDMGLLYGNIPFYSGNPTTMTSADANAFGKYMDALWGFPLSGTGGRANMDGSYDDAYNSLVTHADGQVGWLQQQGFYNMTLKWFGDWSFINGIAVAADKRAAVNKVYDLWPKGPGDNHILMFRKMASGDTKAAVVWGQNPAVTEPNQTKVREGLKNLELLVVADLFETETAACDRKATGVTYLLPACSHVEEAGSVTNSGRTLQWRERAVRPRGNSKADLELLLRLAKALDTANAFTHITDAWGTISGHPTLGAYAQLFAGYGWTPGGATDFEDVPATLQMWKPGETAPQNMLVHGSEVIAENIYKEWASGVVGGGTGWIYTGGWTTASVASPSAANTHANQDGWVISNRAKSRVGLQVTELDTTGYPKSDPNGTFAYPGWGYSWLVNRRVLYNNNQAAGDVADFFMGPDSAARLFVSTRDGVLNYSRFYRTIHKLVDKPDVALGGPTTTHILPGRFPAHVEPYETPKAGDATYMAKWGRNTKGVAAWECVYAGTRVAGKTDGDGAPAAKYPFVMTSIRCVEHFQGGPTTRNNAWNHEAEPEPWVEINSYDARALGIVTGDYVNVITARSNSTTEEKSRTINPLSDPAPHDNLLPPAGFKGGDWCKGFKARVGVGLSSTQRVAPGTVAIPWHWGDRGLSVGSRANDLCIDAMDANTTIPEYKACLCNITKNLTMTPAQNES